MWGSRQGRRHLVIPEAASCILAVHFHLSSWSQRPSYTGAAMGWELRVHLSVSCFWEELGLCEYYAVVGLTGNRTTGDSVSWQALHAFSSSSFILPELWMCWLGLHQLPWIMRQPWLWKPPQSIGGQEDRVQAAWLVWTLHINTNSTIAGSGKIEQWDSDTDYWILPLGNNTGLFHSHFMGQRSHVDMPNFKRAGNCHPLMSSEVEDHQMLVHNGNAFYTGVWLYPIRRSKNEVP